MKKALAVLMLLTLLVSVSACTAEEKTPIRLGALKGATTIGLVKLLSDIDENNTQNAYQFTLAASADELTPKLIQGQMDVLAVPANLAAILYQKTKGQVQFMAVNTLGVVYIVEKGGEAIQTMEDLKGKTIYATGKGTTPEYALAYLLSSHGMSMDEDVNMEWKSEPTETVAALNAAENAVAMLPQPFVTVAMGQVEGLRVALDLTEEWDKMDNGSQFITAGLIVRKEFADTHEEALQAFLREYEASTRFANENPAEAAKLTEKYGIVKAAVAEKAIPACHIVYMDGAEMKQALSGYLQTLFNLNPASIGGAMPNDDFYYDAENTQAK